MSGAQKWNEEIEKDVLLFISKTLHIPLESITLSMRVADLSQDSIQLFELLLAFERYYEVEASYDRVVNLHTVEDIVQYVAEIKQSL